jgi:hypothetical protein
MVTGDRIGALEALLTRTEAAHGDYETDELGGVYDRDWASWYARYAVEHGVGELVGRAVTADELAAFFTSSWGDAQRADPKPTESWATYTARQIADGL